MRRHLWWVLGLVLVCGGLAVALSAQAGPDDFGWFAYTPLSDDPDWQMGWRGPMSNGSALILSRWQLAGAAGAALGLMVLAGGVGFRLGRRRTTPREQA
jgi:heme/copper-type cytochrome/quinol oxidase subunit 1